MLASFRSPCSYAVRALFERLTVAMEQLESCTGSTSLANEPPLQKIAARGLPQLLSAVQSAYRVPAYDWPDRMEKMLEDS